MMLNANEGTVFREIDLGGENIFGHHTNPKNLMWKEIPLNNKPTPKNLIFKLGPFILSTWDPDMARQGLPP